MPNSLPTPVRALLGLAAFALEEARKFPETLPTAVTTVPVEAVSAAMQASLKFQQHVATLAAKGDEVISQFRGSPTNPPEWATFDDDLPSQDRPLAAFDRAENAFDATPLDATPLDATPLDATPFDATPFDATPFDAAPLDPGLDVDWVTGGLVAAESEMAEQPPSTVNKAAPRKVAAKKAAPKPSPLKTPPPKTPPPKPSPPKTPPAKKAPGGSSARAPIPRPVPGPVSDTE